MPMQGLIRRTVNQVVKKKTYRTRNNRTANVSQRVKNYVNKTIDRKKELKEYIESGESQQSSGLLLSAWVADSCLDMTQGVSDGNRIADKIEVSNIYIGTSILWISSNQVIGTIQLSDPTVRVVVVQLKRGYTITELVAELPLDSPTAPLTKFDIQRRCHVLKDVVIKYNTTLNVYPLATLPTSSYILSSKTVPLRFNIRPKIRNITWDSDTVTAVPADIMGAVYILYLYNLAGASTAANVPQAQDQPDVRITYRDA